MGASSASAGAVCAVWQTLLLIAAFLSSVQAADRAIATGSTTCPGLQLDPVSGIVECTAECQQRTCAALATFFIFSYSPSNPALRSWRNRQGWETTLTQSCDDILALPGYGGMPSYCGWYGITCCTSAPAFFNPFALVNYPACSVLKSVTEINLQVNGLKASIADIAFQQSIAQLHACGVMRLVLPGNSLSGSLTDFWGDLSNLTALNLAKNSLGGTIPDALRRLSKLVDLELDRNAMYGTLPAWLSELQSLQWLSLSALTGRNTGGKLGLTGTIPGSLGDLPLLSVLNFGANSLTGSVPPNLCHPNIKVLDMRKNQIHGEMNQLLNCTNAFILDISSNKFTGVLPELTGFTWFGMGWVDVSSNAIEGTIPMSWYKMQQMSTLTLANNRLNGTINSALGRMPNLMNVNLGHNQFTGPLEDSIWYIPRLQSIDLSNNQLTGTLSPAIGMSYYTQGVVLANNRLQGAIPAELGLISSLVGFDVMNNSFSCSSADPDADGGRCDLEELLPCFLQLDPAVVPVTTSMKCPMVVRKGYAQAVQDCSGQNSTQLGDLAANLANVDSTGQHWFIDPLYYQYSGCNCLGGYHAVWSQGGTVLECIQDTKAILAPWFIPTAVVVSFIVLSILIAVALMVWLRMTVQLRRKWQREQELMKNRLKGVPNGGPASIVVTDVESYSAMMQQNAIVTTRAIGIHNAILRKAVTAHAGHVIEQEGDSWSIAFHRPVDAVAFCLQVQQALQRSHWPAELTGPAASKDGPERYASIASATSESSAVTAEVIIKPGAGRHNPERSTLKPTALATSTGPDPDHEQEVVSSGNNALERISSTTTRQTGLAGLLHLIADLGGYRRSGSVGELEAPRNPSISQAQGRMAGRGGKPTESSVGDAGGSWSASVTQRKAQRHATCESGASSDRETSITQTPSKAGRSSMTWMSQGKRGVPKADAGSVCGMKVRMGVASGCVPANSDITRSPLFELAKAVSDMAHGGQILLESGTATSIRDWLTDLGGVDHKGYNDKLLLKSNKAHIKKQAQTALGCVTIWLGAVVKFASHDRDAILLDMGRFWVPSIAKTVQTAAAAATASTADQGTNALHKILAQMRGRKSRTTHEVAPRPALHVLPCTNAAIAAAAAAIDRGGAVGASCGSLQLYTVLARPLRARSKIWKSELNIPSGAQQIAKGYFDAPSTVMADLVASAFLEVERPLLPPVTIVFAAVEGGKGLVHKNERVAAIIHNVLSRVMQALLLSLPDGYLCREQEAVLKYMVAFKEPTKAVEWCIMMQEVLQQLPWHSDVVESFASYTARQTISSGGGRASSSSTGFGGHLRLKMGLAEGVPGEIAPDHLGRADYFGTSVNLAARITSAAAHPGQVIMSMETAQTIFSSWQYEAELSSVRKAVEAGQHQSHPNGWQHFTLSGIADDAGAEGRQVRAAAAAPISAAEVSFKLQAAQKAAEEAGQLQPQHYSLSGNGIPQENSITSPIAEHQSSARDGIGGPDALPAANGSTAFSKGNQVLLQPVACQLLGTEGAAVSNPRMPAALGHGDTPGITLCSADGSSGNRLVHISCHNVGTYAFKGCGTLDMVCVTTSGLLAEAQAQSHVPHRAAKGALIMASSGPVLGLQDCPVMLPDILTKFRQAWASMANLEPHPAATAALEVAQS